MRTWPSDLLFLILQSETHTEHAHCTCVHSQEMGHSFVQTGGTDIGPSVCVYVCERERRIKCLCMCVDVQYVYSLILM